MGYHPLMTSFPLVIFLFMELDKLSRSVSGRVADKVAEERRNL